MRQCKSEVKEKSSWSEVETSCPPTFQLSHCSGFLTAWNNRLKTSKGKPSPVCHVVPEWCWWRASIARPLGACAFARPWAWTSPAGPGEGESSSKVERLRRARHTWSWLWVCTSAYICKKERTGHEFPMHQEAFGDCGLQESLSALGSKWAVTKRLPGLNLDEQCCVNDQAQAQITHCTVWFRNSFQSFEARVQL